MIKKRKKRKKKKVRYPQDRLEGDLPRDEYQWLNDLNTTTGPGIPSNLNNMSATPELTLAWVYINCKFAKGCNENDVNIV